MATLRLLKCLLFYCMYVSFFPAFMYVFALHARPVEVRRGHRIRCN